MLVFENSNIEGEKKIADLIDHIVAKCVKAHVGQAHPI
jgi:hypothetical protein